MITTGLWQATAPGPIPCASPRWRGRAASVTVVARNCAEAEAWATALMVAGEDESRKLARQRGLNALFLVRSVTDIREVAVGPLFAAGLAPASAA